MDYPTLQAQFANHADPERAPQMARYLRNQFAFYGIASPNRKRLYHDFLKAEKKRGVIDWDLLDAAWADPHREMQYFVCDYLVAMAKWLTWDDLFHVEQFVRSKQWWETIDTLIKPIGALGLRDPRVADLMRQWAVDADFWVRRVAIEHQLLRKERTDQTLLAEIIEANLNSSEFFINKAIGWALRDYSKTNPAWVAEFVATHRDGLSPLSVREASKYL